VSQRLPNIQDFKRITFFTGAGLSAESGVPTYRGQGGIWKEYDYERYACQTAFERDPQGVWEFHNYRRQLVNECQPNRSHELIAEAQRTRPGIEIVTQNIDGLHQLAGATDVLELHGSLWWVRCDSAQERIHSRDVPFNGQRNDGYWWRPDIVWFGDNLRHDVISTAIDAVSNCDLLISIGTSAVVYPAAGLPLKARANGATLIEINPETTPISHCFDICMRSTATLALEALFGENESSE
jgi:NAD-dependent deacetylase